MRLGLPLLVLVVLMSLVAPAGATNVVVQGTTDVRDAGLVDDVLVPGFHAAYPQYDLQYIAVGTGQALTNARAGQGDAVLTHAPTLEQQFVLDGYSAEPVGRAIFYSDYVILGPRNDPAAVGSAAARDAVRAFELIAQAGAAGQANFVSRGDNSGTNVEEQQIWAQTQGVPLIAKGSGRAEPGTGSTNPSWYRKAGGGQAATVQVADQCTFPGGNCYDISDRGTFNRLVANGAVSNLKVVAERNDPNARGGQNLLVNPFHAYAVDPAKVPSANLAGALAFLDYLTSPALQNRLASYPTAANPAFFADARPDFSSTTKLPRRVFAGRSLTVTGSLRSRLPGAGPLAGAPLALQRITGLLTAPEKLDTVSTAGGGGFGLTGPINHSGALQVSFSRFQDLSPATFPLGSVSVQSTVAIGRVRASRLRRSRSGRVRIRGTARPLTDRAKAQVALLGRPSSRARYRQLRHRALPNGRGGFDFLVKLRRHRWQLRVEYRDPGAVRTGRSRTLHVWVR